MEKRMQPSNSMNKDFLKKWQMGLQIFQPSINNTNISERKKAIKISADIAMASLRKGTTCWSRALIDKIATQEDSKYNLQVRTMLTKIHQDSLINKKLPKIISHRKIVRRSKKILLKPPSSRARSSSFDVAKRLVKKRKLGLRNVVPGGEYMKNEILLIRETLDYIVSLQTQVNVMKSIVDVVEAENKR